MTNYKTVLLKYLRDKVKYLKFMNLKAHQVIIKPRE